MFSGEEFSATFVHTSQSISLIYNHLVESVQICSFRIESVVQSGYSNHMYT